VNLAESQSDSEEIAAPACKLKIAICHFPSSPYLCHPIFKIRPSVMKKDIHPDYRYVVFKDISTDYAFLSKSTIKSRDTITWQDGNEYPLVKLDISSDSHPFFTGKQKLVDSAGRVDKFNQRYGKKK
jgi:large subunit ribosomal protein L31